jgi:hypothetical protein
MPYLVIRTDVRPVTEQVVDATDHARDERHEPERRRQTAVAETFDIAMRLARALSSACGDVRTGRQRVKVIRVG